MERPLTRDRAAALADAVAHELNEELTMILGCLDSGLPSVEKLQTVEEASLRCAVLTRRLQSYAIRRGRCQCAVLDAVLEEAS